MSQYQFFKFNFITFLGSGIPTLQVGDQYVPIPSNLFGVTIRFSSNFIEIAFTVIKVNIKWDTKVFKKNLVIIFLS